MTGDSGTGGLFTIDCVQTLIATGRRAGADRRAGLRGTVAAATVREHVRGVPAGFAPAAYKAA